MAHGPDWSDSEDSLFADDGDYDDFKKRYKNYKTTESMTPLTDEQVRQQDLNHLSKAVSSGNIERVLELLNKGINVNESLQDGWTPIQLAACYGNPELTKVLIEQGADVNKDREAMTPLMMACNCPDYTSSFDKSLNIIKLLVEKKANVKAINRKRMDALMHAATIGHFDAVAYLLPLSNRQALDNQRWSALTWAVSNNQVEVVKFLLSEGFNMHLADVRGYTALEIARDNGFEDIVNLFPQKEVDIISDIIETNRCSYQDIFCKLQKGEKPPFFSEAFEMLVALKCDSVVPLFSAKNVSLGQFLTMTDADLKECGVLLPYQRSRIQTGLHRFHKQPYHPKSLHVCGKNSCYSNLDLATQLLSAITQVIAMESSLVYIMKTWNREKLTKEDRDSIARNFRNIKIKIKSCKMVVQKLDKKVTKWDRMIKPADLITKHSIKCKIPWKKITLCFGIATLVLLYKIRK